ncbi:Cytochrome b5 [Penicillium sp. IBT 35674x]|nr:Cytochrome b5 [Penicillium sp. IBT 35674x]
MSELRQRQAASATSKRKESSPQRPQQTEEDHGISVLDILRLLATIVLGTFGISYYMTNGESVLFNYRPWYTRWPVVKQWIAGPVSLTPAQLSLYDGSDESLPIYLAVNGSIFDVSANPGMYGPGGGYHFFAGRDATRAFVTGCFSDDLTPDLSGVEEMFMPVEDVEESLTSAEKKVRREREMRHAKAQIAQTVARWEKFFGNSKKYFRAGKVVGVEKDAEDGKRILCGSAQNQRPKRSEMNEGV